MKKVMIALAFVAVSTFAACGGSTPEGEVKAADSTSVCATSPDSVVVACTATVAVEVADTTK
jgi:hypothetical protein